MSSDHAEDTPQIPGSTPLPLPASETGQGHTIQHYLFWTLGILFFIKFILPFVTIVTVFLVFVTLSLLLGIVFVKISKRDESNLRQQFPRFKFTRSDRWTSALQEIRNEDAPFEEPPFATPFNVATDGIVQLVIRDFIMGWFRSISQSQGFPKEVRLQMRKAFYELEQRASKMDVAKFLVLDIVPLLTRHLTNVCVAEENVIGDQLKSFSGSTELELKVAKEYDNISKVHPSLSLKATADTEKDRKTYARERMAKIVTSLLPKEETNSAPVTVLVREIMANCVLFPIIRLLSDPDFWNTMIIKISLATLKDRDQVRELRNAIEEQYNNPSSSSKLIPDKKITPHMKQPEFQQYIKTIDKCTSLAQLKQMKYYVAIQLSRTQRINSTSEKFIKYTKRLSIAKSQIDKRIADLSGTPSKHNEIDFISNLTLSQILNNPSSLSFFMEFMEQRGRTVLLQYWLTVQGIKDPLEDPHNPEEEMSLSADISGEVEDVKSIVVQFFDKKLLRVDPAVKREAEGFVQGEVSVEAYNSVRKSILMLQVEVFHRMEERDLLDFKASELFLKLLASDSFEQSLVNEVDDGAVLQETESKAVPEHKSLVDLENVLSDILKKDHSILSETPSSMSSSSEALSKRSDIKSDLFGSEDGGFLDQKPLFEESDLDEEEIVEDDEEEDDKLSTYSQEVLGFRDGIDQLNSDISKLTTQSEMLDPLILKAELTNNAPELRLLRKSKLSYQREIESKELLKQQLIVQDNENSLFGKTNVTIGSWIKARDSAKGKDYVVYLVEVEKSADGEPATWIVGRRFNQFYRLNEILKRECPEVESIQFPKKKIVLKFHQKLVLDERQQQLEAYLRQLLSMRKVCQNKEFRNFLTTDDYRPSAASDSPSMESSSVFEIRGTANKIYNGLYSLGKTNSTTAIDEMDTTEPQGVQADELRKELESYESSESRSSNRSFVKPITDLFLALFPLNNRANSWLRGRAIIVVLQQVLGSTIEKHIKGQISGVASQEKMVELVSLIQGILWPEGQFMQSGAPRTQGEKLKNKKEARLLLETLMVDSLSKFVGQSGSKTASHRVHSMLQNETLNTNLCYEVLDRLFDALFPELGLS